jgi:site-specific DNA-methyltransferase (adenine-specific)
MAIDLYHIDCMEYMATQPDGAFDLAICDPPYGIGEANDKRADTQYGNAAAPSKRYGKKQWDKASEAPEYFAELRRVSKNQIIWGANHYIDKMALPSACWIVWDKQTGSNGYADGELAWTSFKSALRIFRFRWAGMLQADMKNKELRIHPTQKPMRLYQWLLTNYAKPGQRILDTHLGSGSSAIAAHYFGVDFVGCEIDTDYFEAAKARIDQETRQIAML